MNKNMVINFLGICPGYPNCKDIRPICKAISGLKIASMYMRKGGTTQLANTAERYYNILEKVNWKEMGISGFKATVIRHVADYKDINFSWGGNNGICYFYDAPKPEGWRHASSPDWDTYWVFISFFASPYHYYSGLESRSLI